MGLRGPVFGAGARGCAATPLRSARGLQRLALDRAGRLGLAVLPNNFPPWQAVYQQTRRWLAAGVFEDDGARFAHAAAGSRGDAQPRAVIFDSRTVQSRESGGRAG